MSSTHMYHCYITSTSLIFYSRLLLLFITNLVHFSHLPLWVNMLLQGTLVGARQHYQATILAIYFLHCCPGTHDSISWPEWEVVQVLVHGVARSLLS